MDEFPRRGYSPVAVATWTRDVLQGPHRLIDTTRGHMEWFCTTALVLIAFAIFVLAIVLASVTHDTTLMLVLAFVAVLIALVGVVWRADIRSRYNKKRRDAVSSSPNGV